MRILTVTNFINHLQIPLAKQIAKMVGPDNFRFATILPPDVERQRLGWNSRENESWILRVGEDAGDRKIFEQWWDNADVVICGEKRFDRMLDRVSKGKLTFYMSERWWKPPIGMARLLHYRFAHMTAQFRQLAKSPFFHYLPIGDYAATDIQRIASFPCRMWQWGYFTELPDPLPTCERTNEGLRILWAGRMLAWKRVDTLILAFSRLQLANKDITLTLVGDGPERKRLEKLAKKLLASGSFRFLAPMPATEVLDLMHQHHVYVLPSSGYEGWGAVINEAMSVACVVVASIAAGSAKTIIRHRENGFLFLPGDWKGLGELLNDLGSGKTLYSQVAREGQRTITECWSPIIAAERFLVVSEALLANHNFSIFNKGPMAQPW